MELDTKRLRYFAETARLLSYRRAAAHLNIAQSALSRHVQALESELGIVLFQRYARGIRLTEAGATLLEHARRVLDQLAEARIALEDMRLRPKGVVTFAVPASYANRYLADIYDIFARDFPEVQLRVMVGATQNIEDWLVNRQADIGVVVEPARYPTLILEHLLREEMYLIGRQKLPWMVKGPVPFAALQDLPLVLPLPSHGSRKLIDAIAAREGVRLQAAIEIDGPHVMTRLIRRHGLFTIMPKSILWGDTEEDDFVAIPLTPPFERRFAIATLAGEPLSLGTRSFARLLRTVVTPAAS